jgi:hypothetical protein
MGRHRRQRHSDKHLVVTGAKPTLSRPKNPPRDAMLDDRITAAEREFVLDHILTALWHGHLTRTVAIDRIMAELGMNQRSARDEVDGFLRD